MCYIELLKLCREYRVSQTRKERYRAIEQLVMSREKATSEALGRHSNHSLDSDSEEDEKERQDEEEMEQELLAVANGEDGISGTYKA